MSADETPTTRDAAAAPTPAIPLPERDGAEVIAELSRFVQDNPLFQAVMETVDGYLMILSPRRQILAANSQFLADFKHVSPGALLGQRPGEALRCSHACDAPGGCGASVACASCGTLGALNASQASGAAALGECLATLGKNGSAHPREFRVRATPVRVEGQDFTVLVLSDISGDKRREALERTFFHDVLNTLGGLLGWCQLLQQVGAPAVARPVERIVFLSQRLKEEIEDHRRLSEAERGSLAVVKAPHLVAEILAAVAAIFEVHDAARGRTLQVEPAPGEDAVVTDPSLLTRVLVNMVKNALEASPEGGVVRVWFARDEGGAPVFRVHNAGQIAPRVEPRIFERYFSTKPERGRGVGAYSMKLFGERYLGGKVGFESSPENGTVFFIRL